jgi:4,5-DOPA dioxygenase extradiol
MFFLYLYTVMDRKKFIQILTLLGTSSCAMKINELQNVTKTLAATETMPVLFMGHGSPMNAIEENEFVKGFRDMGLGIRKPSAILCVSAHWETKGTFVTAMNTPRTIHDFGGFPQALFDVQYPAPGSTEMAQQTATAITKTTVGLDDKWGLDHGCWSVVKHLYPNADVPVLQLSLDYTQPPQYHYELAQQLQSLRQKGVLIIGSGNIVHNLGMVAWDKMNVDNYAYDWAAEVKEKINSYIKDENFGPLINFKNQGKAFDLAIPTPDHYLPLLYTLALKNKNEKITFYNDKALAGSLTMTSLKIETV